MWEEVWYGDWLCGTRNTTEPVAFCNAAGSKRRWPVAFRELLAKDALLAAADFLDGTKVDIDEQGRIRRVEGARPLLLSQNHNTNPT